MASGGLYTVELDQDSAKALARDGGALLLLGVPQGTVVGIDHQTFIVGQKFKGVKMLPPGTHLLAYNSVSKQGDFSATTSFFFDAKPRQVLVRRWDPEQELLVPVDDEDEEERYAEGVRRFDFDDSLAPYNLRAQAAWQRLSGHIDASVIDRLSPAGNGNISITAEAAPAQGGVPSEAEEKLARQLAAVRVRGSGDVEDRSGDAAAGDDEPSTSGKERGDAAAPPGGGACRYTRIPRTLKRHNLSPEQLTLANMDKSELLEDVIRSQYGGKADSMLGELQFAFLAFVVGQSLEAFGQWKALLHLLLACEAAPLHKRPKFYSHVLQTVQAQLDFSMGQEGPNSQAAPLGVPMVEELLADSFLKHLFATFFDCLATAEHPLDPALKAAQDGLQATLQQKLGWDFRFSELGGHESDDEYAPVVVDL